MTHELAKIDNNFITPYIDGWVIIEIISRRFDFRSKFEPETPLSAQSFRSRADNGRGLILRAITETLFNNMFITYSNSLLHEDVQQCKYNGEWA